MDEPQDEPVSPSAQEGGSAGRADRSANAVATASGSASAGSMDTSAPSAPASSSPRWLGKRVGRYKLISLLGKGAYGRVFLADDVDLQRRVALKVITADATARSVRAGAAEVNEAVDSRTAAEAVKHAVDRMIREARAAARIEHPGVVQIYEIGRLEGAGLGGFIAMELLDGGTLQDLVDVNGAMDVARACTLIADAAEALHYAHELGVIHRDVKPANLMLSRQGRCKIADFGLAYVEDPAHGHRWAAAAGTPLYLSPEVILGHPADAKSDQYSLAATLFAVLAARPPYVGSRRKILEAHVHAPPPDLRPVRPDLDPRLGQVIARAMSKDPTSRYPTIRHLGKALRLFTVALPAHDLPIAGGVVEPSLIGAGSFEAANAAAAGRRQMAHDASASMSAIIAPATGTTVRERIAQRRGRPSSMTPLLIGSGAALLVILAAVLWAAGVFSGTPDEPLASSGPPVVPALQPPSQNPVPAAAAVDNQSAGGAELQRRAVTDQGTSGAEQAAVSPAPVDQGSEVTRPPPVQQTGGSRRSSAGNPGGSAAPASGKALAATEFDRLIRIAEGKDAAFADRTATVTGKVRYARHSRSGEVFNLRFEGTDRTKPAFLVSYYPGTLFGRMEERFGGDAGSALFGKTIRVTGKVTVHRGEPQIVVRSPDQIVIVDG